MFVVNLNGRLIFRKMTKKIKLLLIIVFVALIAVLGSWLYYQSEQLKNRADSLLKYGNAKDALAFYKRAQSTFPLRFDLANNISGTKLIIKSNQDYNRITELAELQEPPPLTNLPSTIVAPNELFIPILMYHHIRINPMPGNPVWAALNVSPDQLDQQLSYLSTHNYHAITLDELSDALDGKISLPPNPIVLTFDDGYRNFYENAFPLLKKYHMKAVQFVITQVLGIPAYLTWDQIIEMDKSGLVEIGAHTRHHPNLPDLSQKEIVDEIKGSKLDLEKRLKKPVHWFAYPYGSYSPFIIQTVRDAGFKGAASTVYGTNQSKDNLYLFPRIMIDGRFSVDNIARRIKQ